MEVSLLFFGKTAQLLFFHQAGFPFGPVNLSEQIPETPGLSVPTAMAVADAAACAEPSRLPPFSLLRQNRLFDPRLVGGDFGVDARDVAPPAADPEAHNADLVPLAVLLADEGAAPITLKKTNKMYWSWNCLIGTHTRPYSKYSDLGKILFVSCIESNPGKEGSFQSRLFRDSWCLPAVYL